MEQYKEIIPWALGIITTILALKKDYIQSKFTNKKSKLEVLVEQENLENTGLVNVEKSLQIFKDMLDTNSLHYKNRITELEQDFENTLKKMSSQVEELHLLVSEQKQFIIKQSKSLDYYESKYGKR